MYIAQPCVLLYILSKDNLRKAVAQQWCGQLPRNKVQRVAMLQGYLEYPARKGVSHAAEALQPLRALRKPCAP